MFIRVVECQAKTGLTEAVIKKVNECVLPILQEQPGFVDLLVLSSKADSERLVCVTFWTSPGDAETYQRRHYDTIARMLKPILESSPRLQISTAVAPTAYSFLFDQAA